MKKINLAKELKVRLVNFLDEQIKQGRLDIGEYLFPEDLLTDDDNYSDWLDSNWSIIKDLDMLIVRDFMTWSYLLDTESQASFELEYYFNESV